MGNWSGWVLQKAVYAHLEGDAALAALVTGIYDNPPEKTVFPYVVLGNLRLSDWSAQAAPGMRVRMDIHAFSQEQGHKQAADITARLQELLHAQTLSVNGQALVNMRVTGSTLFTEPDGITQHGLLELEAVTQMT